MLPCGGLVRTSRQFMLLDGTLATTCRSGTAHRKRPAIPKIVCAKDHFFEGRIAQSPGMSAGLFLRSSVGGCQRCCAGARDYPYDSGGNRSPFHDSIAVDVRNMEHPYAEAVRRHLFRPPSFCQRSFVHLLHVPRSGALCALASGRRRLVLLEVHEPVPSRHLTR